LSNNHPKEGLEKIVFSDTSEWMGSFRDGGGINTVSLVNGLRKKWQSADIPSENRVEIVFTDGGETSLPGLSAQARFKTLNQMVSAAESELGITVIFVGIGTEEVRNYKRHIVLPKQPAPADFVRIISKLGYIVATEVSVPEGDLGQIAGVVAQAGANEAAVKRNIPISILSPAAPGAAPAGGTPANAAADGLCVTGDTLLPIISAKEIPNPKSQIPNSNDQNNGLEFRSLDIGNCLEFGACDLEFKRIADVKENDYALSLNEETQEIEPRRINALLDMGVKPVYRLTTASGRSIKTTANHPYLVRNQKPEYRNQKKSFLVSGYCNLVTPERSEGKWVKVSGLTAGDEIACPRDGFSGYGAVPGEIAQESAPQNKCENNEVNHQNKKGNDIEDIFIHRQLPFRFNNPEHDNQRKYPGKNIKGQKVHNFFSSILVNLAAIFKNSTVMAMPIEHATQGILPAAPGTNTPTTSDAKIIFAPSRKKSENTSFDFSLSDIQFYSDIHSRFVKGKGEGKVMRQSTGAIYYQPFSTCEEPPPVGGATSQVFYYGNPPFTDRLQGKEGQEAFDLLWDKIVSIEPLGLEHVYDIEVDGTHNFIANGIFAHNTYISAGGAAANTTVVDQGRQAAIDRALCEAVRQKCGKIGAVVVSGDDSLAEAIRARWGFDEVLSARNNAEAITRQEELRYRGIGLVIIINVLARRVTAVHSLSGMEFPPAAIKTNDINAVNVAIRECLGSV